MSPQMQLLTFFGWQVRVNLRSLQRETQPWPCSRNQTSDQHLCTSQGLLGYEPTFRRYLKCLLQTAIADGVAWVETRINFIYP